MALSFVQVYLDEVSDLLNPEAGPLQIREERERPYVQGVVQVEIESVEEGYALVDAGIVHRIVAAQQLNVNSSRSHTLLTVAVSQVERDAMGQLSESRATITFVDLAGSERIKKTNSKYGYTHILGVCAWRRPVQSTRRCRHWAT